MDRYYVALAATLTLAAWAKGGEPPDLGKLERSIRKEPAYTSKQPLYSLLAFGPKAERRVWLVLDQSKPDGSRYDVLYLDRNADGDLTAPGKRLVAKAGDGGPVFELPEFKDPAIGVAHTDFRVRLTGEHRPTVMISLRWRGERKLGGGYPTDPEAYMYPSPRPETAPVVWFQGDGPFRFQRWYGGRLPVGGEEDFKVFLGQLGWGPSSFCAFQEHVLPDGEAVQATLIYTDQGGRERRVDYALQERC